MAEERAKLRAIFDEAALLYDEVRPDYPEELFDDVVSLSEYRRGEGYLRSGAARARLRYPSRAVATGFSASSSGRTWQRSPAAISRRTRRRKCTWDTFEAWRPQEAAFDLAVSATAFHWLDPDVAYPKVAGTLPSHGITRPVLERAHGRRQRLLRGGARGSTSAKRPRSSVLTTPGGFPAPTKFPEGPRRSKTQTCSEVKATRQYRWDEPYDAAGYLQVLDTYSGHRSPTNHARERLFHGIADLIRPTIWR